MKKALLIIALLICTGLVVAWKMWNKPHTEIDQVDTKTVTAIILTQVFTENEAEANKQYLNQALTVSGRVQSIETNEDGQQVLLLEGVDALSGVQCTMTAPLTSVKEGDDIAVSGFCNGFTTVVILNDCKVLSAK